MKINELKCPASLEGGILTLDDGTDIDLNEVYGVLADLAIYAEDATLEGDGLPACVTDADKLLEAFS